MAWAERMAVVCTELDLLVTAAPGAGSTSLLGWALRLPGAVAVPASGTACPPDLDPKHATITRLRSAGMLPPRASAVVLTSTRNPFDYWHAEWFRTRTRWAKDAQDPGSWVHDTPGMTGRIERALRLAFGDWLEIELGRRADRGDQWHLNPGHIAEADVVLRMECLQQDLQTLLPRIAAAGVSIPHRNATSGRGSYVAAYSERPRQVVAQIHQPDIERFGYTFTDGLVHNT